MEINYNNRLTTANLIICPNLRQVIVGKEVQNISPVNMKVLMLLIKNQGQVVTRGQLFDEVWTNQEVSDDTLTRCISDLRAQTGKEKIKTLPKKGYQWKPIVKQASNGLKETKTINKTLKALSWMLMVFLGVLLLSIASLWVAEKIIKPSQVRIAILPIKIKSKNQDELVNHIASLLKSEVIKSEKLKLLSSRVINGNTVKPYPSLSLEYGAQWIIEGQLTDYRDNVKLTLSLVDARTALVVFSNSSQVGKDAQLLRMCQEFILKIQNISN